MIRIYCIDLYGSSFAHTTPKPMYIPRYILLLAWLCICADLPAQQPQLSLRHYTTDDGLPSPEVYEVLQDWRGYLWFATDNGLSRFNGYEFRNYSVVDGLTDLVIFYLQEDQRGRIWMGTMSGQIFYYEPTKDKIYAFWGNQEIKKLQGQFPSIGADFYADVQDTVHVALTGYGILKFLPDSSTQVIRPAYQTTIVYQLPETVLTSGASYPLDKPEGQYYQKRWSPLDSTPVTFYHQNRLQKQILPYNRKNAKVVESYFLNKNKTLIRSGSYLHYYRNNNRIWTILFSDDIVEFFQNQQGALFFGMNHINGCRKYANLEALRQNRYETILPGYTVPGILQDREGGYWFTTIQNGVFYCPRPDWKIYNAQSGLANSYVASVTLKNENEWFLALSTGQVYYQNATLQQLEDLKAPANFCDDILYDAPNQRLWAGLNTSLLFYGKLNRWERATGIHPITKKTHTYTIYYRLWQDENDQAIWGGSFSGFAKIPPGKTSSGFLSNYIGIAAVRTLAVIKNKDGKVWVGRVDGLHEFRENEKKLYPPEVRHPAFQLRIEALAGLPDTTLVIGTKGAGILLYKGKNIHQLTVKEGLTTNIIETLHVDGRGTIWAGTLNGLNKITRNGDTFSIEHFTTAHGLPSNEINKIVTRNGKVWVATMRGLVVFQDDYQRNPVSPTPILEAFWVNDKAVLDWKNLQLRYFENNLRLQFTSLQFRNAGKIQYRYRLTSAADWTHTSEYQLNFAALRPDNYTFEVQAQNEDGVWSTPAKLPFLIRPAWWQTGWFYSSLALLIAAGGFWYNRSRIHAIRHKADIAAQITDLERKALAAQMNPHFVFNCLNSIQLLIREKEENQALQYLARFAKLIRSLLEFSRRGKVTILEEVQALENYLELEKLRFKEKLSYEIQVAEEVDQFETEIPPLLVQPFVENALKHGLSNLENGGMIKITFGLENDTLLIRIQDNGKGYDTNNEIAGRHRSMGIELTRRRLALANGRTELEDLTIQSNENQVGTQVQIRIFVSR